MLLLSIYLMFFSFYSYKPLIILAPWRFFEIVAVITIICLVIILFSIIKNNSRINKIIWIGLMSTSSFILLYTNYNAFNTHYSAQFPKIKTEKVEISRAQRQMSLRQCRAVDSLTNAEVIEKSSKYVQGQFQFYKYEPVYFENEIDWSFFLHDDPSWNWSLHNLTFICELTLAYELTKDVRYLDEAEHHILDWIGDNTLYLYEPPSKFSWNDHSTAFRLMHMMYFYQSWKKSELYSEATGETIFRSMLGHANLLSKEEFYTPNHNHGIDQDRALLAFSLQYDNLKYSSGWQSLALERVSKQFRFSVSQSGVHLEHSPSYHFTGIRQHFQILDLLVSFNVNNKIKDGLAEILKRMYAYIPYIVKPDGELAKIGDSGATKITNTLSFLPKESVPLSLKKLLSSGKLNNEADEFKIFKEEGYSIYRNFSGSRNKFENSLYLFFTAASNAGRGHKQSDLLSFILFNMGQEILIDQGYYAYINDKKREYVTSVLAHNTVVINDKSYEGDDVSIENSLETDDIKLIQAAHSNYDGYLHRRWLVIFKNDILILDSVNSLRPENQLNNFKQVFNFSPELELFPSEINSGSFQIQKIKTGEKIGVVDTFYNQGIGYRVAKGEVEPMYGWHSLEHNKLIPTSALIYEVEKKNVFFVTRIHLPNNTKFNGITSNTLDNFINKNNNVTFEFFNSNLHYRFEFNDEKSQLSIFNKKNQRIF